MENSTKKIVLIGCGMVGNSFLYSSINRKIANNYVLIDSFKKIAVGNAIDLLDASSALENSYCNIKAGDYEDCKDADLIVITAGRPQFDNETRLDMVIDNSKIMKEISLKIKNSKFNGVTLIASNPVDILSTIYQKITGYSKNKVISSGTTLDSARLKRLISNKLNVSLSSVNAYVLGEHGDSSVSIWSKVLIAQKTIYEFILEKKIDKKDLEYIHQEMIKTAYKIINFKKSTFYGIGVCLSSIAKAILNNERKFFLVGAKCEGEYNINDIYIGVPAIIGINGVEEIIKWKLTNEEQNKLEKSAFKLKKSLDIAISSLK